MPLDRCSCRAVQTAGRKVKIPNACIGMNVEWFTGFQMLSASEAKSVLQTRRASATALLSR